MPDTPPADDTREWLFHQLSKEAAKETPYSTFIPRDKIRNLTTLDIIRGVLENDQNVPEHEKDELANYAHNHAPSLFLILIRLRLRLKVLREAKEEGITDRKTLPIGGSDAIKAPWIEDHEDKTVWEADLHMFQWIFHAACFSGFATHQDFDPRVIIPYTYKERCGAGAFSIVYAVQLEASHQDIYALPDDSNPKLALKSIDRRAQDEAFRHEQFLLQGMLDTRHLHIIELLATYRQHGRWHFLFPLAECNLQQYMENHEANRSKPFIKWMLSQVAGLAQGLQLIHENSKKIPLDEAPNLGNGETSDLQGWKRPVGTGYHHDLKPQNILHFTRLRSEITTPSPELGVLQIADFGVGKFHGHLPSSQDSSKGTQHPRGTPTYAAPESRIPALYPGISDTQAKLHLSRPYDVWSLGCVIMEMLVWLMLGQDEWSAFGKKRQGNVQEGSNAEISDAYWIADENFKTAKVRDQVMDMLERLKHSDLARKSKGLSLMIGLVDSILEKVDPKERMLTTDVIALMKEVLENLESDNFEEGESIRQDATQLAQPVKVLEGKNP